MPTVTLLSYTPEPVKTVAAAAKLCYSHSDIETLGERLDDASANDFVRMLARIGHESPLEHASFTFGIQGVSRAFLAQITRHRIASYSVQSQRYVEKKDFPYVIPPAIAEDPRALAEFERVMRECAEGYERLARLLAPARERELVEQGVGTDQARKRARKLAIEDARFVLPNACDTRMVVTMNARSLRNFFRLRCCRRAQWEIRETAGMMLRLARDAAPALFEGAGPPCLSGPCPEGASGCGREGEARREYGDGGSAL